ncbi:FMN-binding glutamate synthase family protein [Gilvimarinus agarilyticus]|uniref:FMN-binding glutamate synthase family protein n=1 Tax=unclassified Gilvimarinus TaxID=2642066 RepID=UPI001C09A7F3|nr:MULTISPECIES: FMN-binding glutamate synthase family protein [unclassified Gilvimarinus]MBU2886992.1 FMN-binding glutamate synthase family protein [Gilvimarinus agarilyticus]MDO6571652.1 FMN-binding glutamate synthase family protein [Gilvimarinus sp. 2_MG-2023]MDO6745724.1 FMN-binding glutamate synthase family protein [Gilvimarinus sp. 1_MG-2023]
MENSITLTILGLFALTLTIGIFALIITAIVLYFIDVNQSSHTIRRNYPVIGRFRYIFEHLGEFFRQYFFAMDREEMPFNRAERSWVYRSAKNVDANIAFGSTRDLSSAGSVMFLNAAFPTLEKDAALPADITLGPYCRQPYTTQSLFSISGMSYGALSAPAIKALSAGAKQSGCWLNTGEGGLSPFHLEGGCDLVFQIGTAKYGVRDKDGHLSDDKLRGLAAIEQVKMFEVKLSQGAKPGKGGILPAEKVSREIADIRGIVEGHASISPNGHPDIRSVEQLLDLLEHVREITGKPVGFKSVIGDKQWLKDLVAAITQRGIDRAPDFITIDSCDGGTGAAPQPLMDYVGLPLKESLPFVCDLLTEAGLRERIKIIASGKLITPSKVAWAIAAGADFTVSARGFMFALGCIQAMQCHKNTCPTGVTTHDPKLQRGLVPKDKAERVAHYQRNMTYGVGMLAHACGVSEPRKLKRQHVHIVTQSGLSAPMSEIYPEPIRLINDGAPTDVSASNSDTAEEIL